MENPAVEPDVQCLARLHRTGDHEAIAQVLLRYTKRLERSIRFRMDPLLRPRVDPSDVVQDTIVEAINRLEDWLRSPDSSLFLWLRFLSLQRLLQLRRYHVDAQRRDARREKRLEASSCADLAEHLVATQTSPSSTLRRKELHGALFRALEQLPEGDREILVLRCLEELSNIETARLLKLKESTASSRFVRALARVQQRLEK